MKAKILAALSGVVILAAGCVKTVNDRHVAAVPFVKDKVEGRYARPIDQVFDAAKEVLTFNGTILRETSLLGGTNTVRVLEGKANQCTVWIKVEAIDPKPITSVVVQARTKAGGSNLNLVHELDKQIALKLVR